MTIKEIEQKMEELQKEINKLKNSSEDEIYLLSIDEYEKYGNEIPQINTWWWLRSPGSLTDSAAYVNGDGYVPRTGYHVYNSTYAVRPALNYSNLKSKISKSKKGEDYFIFNEIRWKIIDKEKEIAISELPIGFEKFDDNSNDYENSYIRQWLLNWLKGAEE